MIGVEVEVGPNIKNRFLYREWRVVGMTTSGIVILRISGVLMFTRRHKWEPPNDFLLFIAPFKILTQFASIDKTHCKKPPGSGPIYLIRMVEDPGKSRRVCHVGKWFTIFIDNVAELIINEVKIAYWTCHCYSVV